MNHLARMAAVVAATMALAAPLHAQKAPETKSGFVTSTDGAGSFVWHYEPETSRDNAEALSSRRIAEND